MSAAMEPRFRFVFGATGDLARRKIFPALYQLCMLGYFPRDALIVAHGRRPFGREAFLQKQCTNIEEDARLSRDEATQRLGVLEVDYTRSLDGLRANLRKGGAAVKPEVARQGANLARRTRARFRQLALTLAAARLNQLSVVERWSRWRHLDLQGLHADFAGPLDLHLALGEVGGVAPQASSFQSLLEQSELSLPGVLGPPLRLSLLEHFPHGIFYTLCC